MTSPFRPRQFLPGILNADVPSPGLAPVQQTLASPGNGPIAGYTNVFDFNLVNFDWVTWHNYEWQNWVQVDALLNTAVGFLNIRGIWRPLTDYIVGDGVYDPDDVTKFYRAQDTHTSTTDFDADILAGHWTVVAELGPPVTSVFGRIGAIIAQETDYSGFFYTKAQTYTKAQVDTSQAAQDTAIGNVNTNANNRVLKAGDTMTGALTLPAADPSAAAHAANKQYVDKRMRWRGIWAAGTYQANDVVIDGDYLFVAKQTTTQKPDNGTRPPTPTQWDLMTTGGSAAVSVGPTPPASPLPGEMWYCTVAPVGLYIWLNDGDSSQWVQTNGGGSTAYLPLSGGTLTGPLVIATDAPSTLKLDSTYPAVWFHDNTPGAAPALPDLSMTAGNGWFRFGNAGPDGVLTDLLFAINPMAPAVVSYLPLSINGNSPQLQFNETDRTDPDGRFRLIVSDNVLHCQKAASAAWATTQSIWTYTTRMNVDVPLRATASCIIEGLVNSAGTAGLQITGSYPSIWFRDPGQSPNPDLYFTAGNGNMRVGPGDAAGNISSTPWSIINSTSGWSTSSDPRLKKNIRDIHYGLDTVMALRAVEFDWIEDDRHDIGFLAPEVREHVPEVVEPLLHDMAGNDDPLLGMRKDALVAVLVKAVQELTLRVQALEAR